MSLTGHFVLLFYNGGGAISMVLSVYNLSVVHISACRRNKNVHCLVHNIFIY